MGSDLEKYKHFIESDFFNMGPMVSFIWKNDSSWSVEAISKNITNNFGFAREDFLSNTRVYADLIHPADLQRVIEEVVIACESKQISFAHQPYRIQNSTQEYRWVKDTTTLLYDQQGEIIHFVGYIIDITDDEMNLLRAKEDEQRLKTAQALAHVGNWELDFSSNTLYWSDEIYRLFELDPLQFAPSYENFLGAIHPEDRRLVNEAYENSLITQEKYVIQHRLLMPDGRVKYVEEQCESYFDEDGKPSKSIGTVHDITQLKSTEIELTKTLSFLESYKIAMDESSIVSRADLSGNIIYVNDNFCEISGYTKEEVLGRPHNIIRHPNSNKTIFKELWETIRSKKVWKGILQNKGKKGDYWIDSTIVPILDGDGEITEYIAIRHDITKIIEHQKTLEKLANTDPLTGFGNRYKLTADIEKSTNPAIGLINIDSFSIFNDFYGHLLGDMIIAKFGVLIWQNNKEDYFSLYRLQADEYALFSPECEKEIFLEYFQKITTSITATPIVIDEQVIQLNITTAISFEKAPILLQTADMAFKVAKLENKDIVIYSDDISLNAIYKNNILWSKKIKNAISSDKIVPYFQPIVNNKTLQYEKYESLVRLIDEEEKVISPYFFLDISKKTKQYTSITKIMIKKSFEYFSDHTCEFSINLTMEDILNEEINSFLFSLLEKHHIGSRVVFEIVESESIQNYETVSEFIKKLKSYGSKIAIDDFGSGYSNFEYILKLNVDYLKIDGSLIKNIVSDTNAKIVVSTIVEFAKKLGIKTIAEFVENEAIFQVMQELEIDYSQGYYFQAPKSETKKEDA